MNKITFIIAALSVSLILSISSIWADSKKKEATYRCVCTVKLNNGQTMDMTPSVYMNQGEKGKAKCESECQTSCNGYENLQKAFCRKD